MRDFTVFGKKGAIHSDGSIGYKMERTNSEELKLWTETKIYGPRSRSKLNSKRIIIFLHLRISGMAEEV